MHPFNGCLWPLKNTLSFQNSAITFKAGLAPCRRAARAIPLPIGDTGKCPEGYRSRGRFISVYHMAWRSPWIALCTSSLIYSLSQFRAERAALRLADGQWTDGNPGTRLMSIPDAFELGRLKNLRRFGDVPG